MINMLLEIIKILHEEMLKTLNSIVLFPQRCIREKELTKWSFQGTSNISIEVLHTSSQLKSTWFKCKIWWECVWQTILGQSTAWNCLQCIKKIFTNK